MRRINLFAIALMAFTMVSISAFARDKVFKAFGTSKLDVATKIQVGGFWADSWNMHNKIATQVSNNDFIITLYPQKEEAWNYYCKIKLKEFTVPDKKNIKKHKKERKDFDFPCDIEFFYNMQYPSLEECFANYGGFIVNSKDSDAKKRTIGGSIHFCWSFFSAGENFDGGESSVMEFTVEIDDTALGVHMLDHLKF